jgi:hypothetical protein
MSLWTGWISRKTRAYGMLAGVALLLANSPLCAQTTTGGGGLGNLGGAGTGAAGGGGGGGNTSGVASQAANLIGNLGPTPGMGPSVTIGGQGVTNRGTGPGSTNIPSSSNVFGPFYYNPYQYGIITTGTSLPSATSLQSTFGQPLYGTATTTTGQAAGTGGLGTTANQGAGFTTLGRSRAPAYYTALSADFPMPQRSPGKLQNELQGILQRTLKAQPIQVRVSDDGRVILRGEVASPRDRERAESQVRITPGVEDVVNEIVVSGTARSLAAPIQRASN